METQQVTTKAEKPNSIELGRTPCKVKIYFDDPEEIAPKVKKLNEMGYTFDYVWTTD